MQKIDPKNQIVVSQDSLATILAEYGIYDFKFEEIKSGAENTTIKITTQEKDSILRIYRHQKKTDQDINLELEFQEYLQNLDIPIPQVYPNLNGQKLSTVEYKGKSWQVLLIEYLGTSDFKKYTPKLLTSLATTQATMHLAGIKFAKKFKSHNMVWDEFKEEIIDKNPGVKIDGEKATDFLKRAKKFEVTLSNDLEHGYNHLDFDPSGNIIIQNNKIKGIIDFDDLAYSACIACLSFTLWHILYTTLNINLAKKYIGEYEQTRFIDKKERVVIPQMLLFRTYEFGVIELIARQSQNNLAQIIKLEKLIPTLSFV